MTTYMADYTSIFSRPCKPAICDVSIQKNEKAPFRAQKETIHKARKRYFTTFEAAEHKTGNFILGVVTYTWLRDFKREKTYYTLIAVGKILTNLQAT